MIEDTLKRWHQMVKKLDSDGLDEVLADEAVFHSPVVHSPQEGKELTKLYLAAAIGVLGASDFHYVREVVGDRDAVLEFTAELDGIHINGVDMIRIDENGKIIDFKVMIRPLKAVNLLHTLMAAMLKGSKPA
ncbi:MAG: nuclear transport factor 2 family protein [bacterium]|nr:nuclear transport factor 2 family protein [bacterium]